VKIEEIKNLTKVLEEHGDKMMADTLRELSKLPEDKQEQALVEFQKLYPSGFELLFGNTKD
jgi:hypothetical protein